MVVIEYARRVRWISEIWPDTPNPPTSVPSSFLFTNCYNMHWGCLSHKLKGARARRQLVYDWVVIGLCPPSGWMGCASILLTVCDARGGVLMMMCKEPNDLSIFAKDSCGASCMTEPLSLWLLRYTLSSTQIPSGGHRPISLDVKSTFLPLIL